MTDEQKTLEEAKAEMPKTEVPAEQDEAPTEPEKKPEPEAVEQALEQAKQEGKLEEIEMPKIKPGMLVRVHQKIKERTAKGEDKERIQVFEGIVLETRGAGNQKTFNVRKVSGGIGVEKIFPLSCPSIAKVEVMKEYQVKRAKLGYLRQGYKKRLTEKSSAK